MIDAETLQRVDQLVQRRDVRGERRGAEPRLEPDDLRVGREPAVASIATTVWVDQGEVSAYLSQSPPAVSGRARRSGSRT